MIKHRPFRVSNSLTDFSPLFFDLEHLFKRLKVTGIDGVEIVIGIKSRWNAKEILKVSQKYEVPVISLHQPVWSGGGIWFDEGFFRLAKLFGVKQITCHPLLGLSFGHPLMRSYLAKLSRMQKENNVEILLENLPVNWMGIQSDTGDIEKLLEVVKQYGLKMTVDIDHMRLKAPHKESWFPNVLPYVGNIHLSSFTPQYKHMPLYLGEFQTKEFISALYKANYQGLLTLELQYPRLLTFFNYDLDMIKKSVEVVKSV